MCTSSCAAAAPDAPALTAALAAAVPQVDRAKVLSNTVKQKRKEKAGKWEVPLPKVSSGSAAPWDACSMHILQGKCWWPTGRWATCQASGHVLQQCLLASAQSAHRCISMWVRPTAACNTQLGSKPLLPSGLTTALTAATSKAGVSRPSTCHLADIISIALPPRCALWQRMRCSRCSRRASVRRRAGSA